MVTQPRLVRMGTGGGEIVLDLLEGQQDGLPIDRRGFVELRARLRDFGLVGAEVEQRLNRAEPQRPEAERSREKITDRGRAEAAVGAQIYLREKQSQDYRNRNSNSPLRPSMFRSQNHSANSLEIRVRYDRLHQAEDLLSDRYSHMGADRIKRYQIIRWAILQHYEVCDTPLLDVTTSLRIAASFASLGNTSEAFIYALGVPNLSGAVTASAEASVTTIRLASVCPPEAVRPHIQEGYLLGEYPEISTWNQKRQYENYETDFGLRLVAKFRFNPQNFWNADKNFPQVRRAALYPSEHDDPLARMMHGIRLQIG